MSTAKEKAAAAAAQAEAEAEATAQAEAKAAADAEAATAAAEAEAKAKAEEADAADEAAIAAALAAEQAADDEAATQVQEAQAAPVLEDPFFLTDDDQPARRVAKGTKLRLGETIVELGVDTLLVYPEAHNEQHFAATCQMTGNYAKNSHLLAQEYDLNGRVIEPDPVEPTEETPAE